MKIQLAALALAIAVPAHGATWECIDSGDGHKYIVSQSVPVDTCKIIDSATRPYVPPSPPPAPTVAAEAPRAKPATKHRATAMAKQSVVAAAPKHGVAIGMAWDEVLKSSWGAPDHINRTITARGTREQWVYGPHNYLYLEDGVLTAIQD